MFGKNGPKIPDTTGIFGSFDTAGTDGRTRDSSGWGKGVDGADSSLRVCFAGYRLRIPMRATQASEEPVISPLTAWNYRHQARRLRHYFRHDPIGLHMSLKALAVRANQASQTSDREQRMLDPTAPASRVSQQRSAKSSRNQEDAPPHSEAIRDTAAALQTPADAVEKFSVLVRTMLGEGILRYSRRKALMRQAGKLGIKPFEASLLIATVENRMRDEPQYKSYSLSPSRRWSVLLGVVSLLILEVAVVGLLAVVLL
jgi:hypothetical protein